MSDRSDDDLPNALVTLAEPYGIAPVRALGLPEKAPAAWNPTGTRSTSSSNPGGQCESGE